MKKKKKRKKKLELVNVINIKIFVKKPQKGGTPAIDKIVRVKIFVNKLEDPKSEKENKVLVSKLTNWKKIKNKTKRDML